MDEGTSELQTTLGLEEPGILRLHFAGKSASREAGRVLAPTFDAALSQATSEHRSLELRFERLEYFNSSTISALVQFIRAAQRAMWDDLRLIVEPGGAAALAAIRTGAYTPGHRERVVVVVCGSNCDPATVTG